MRAATLPYKVRRITFSVQLGLVAHPDFWVVIGYGRKSITSSYAVDHRKCTTQTACLPNVGR